MNPDLPTLGLRLPNSGPFGTAESILYVADLAERLNYHTVWVHDHISWPRHELTHFATGSLEACKDQDSNFFESVETLGVLAGRLKRARLGIAGLVLPLRDPRVLAKQLATLDQFSNGRLTIGMGSGAKENDFKIMGLPWERRGKIMNEYLATLLSILRSDQPVSVEGERISFKEGSFYPKPRGMRIWVAGKSAVGMTRAVRFADGWLTHVATPDEYAGLYQELVRRLDAAGRDEATFDTSLELFACVANTHQEAYEMSRLSLGRRAEDVEEANLVGTPAEIAARLELYRKAGAKHIEARMICHSIAQLEEMAETLAESTGLVGVMSGARQ